MFLCGYIKGFSTKYALLSLTERSRLGLDKEGFAQGFINGSIKNLKSWNDTINLELLIAKLRSYGFSIETLEFTLSYLQKKMAKSKD